MTMPVPTLELITICVRYYANFSKLCMKVTEWSVRKRSMIETKGTFILSSLFQDPMLP